MNGDKLLRSSGMKGISNALIILGCFGWYSHFEANAADRLELPAHSREQIESLIAEKAARSLTQRKLDSQLLYALRQQRQQRVAAGVAQLENTVRPKADGRVLVDLRADVTQGLLAFVESRGGTVVNQHPRFQAIRALVSFDLIEALASRPEVRNVRPADEARTNVGPITSQGDTTHQASVARNNLVVDGSGVKVGVLSDSVDYLANSQVAGELPSVTVLPGRAGFGSGEGTAMLEIVHDIAPGAELYFSTAFQGVAAFAQSILDLHAAGCRIIVDDITYFSESPFQDGPIARAVNEVSAAGTLFFSSAGNSGNFNDGTSSTWEGNFRDGGPATLGRGGRLHDFGGSTFNTLNFGSSPRVDLFWADPLGASTNDYDVYLISANGNIIASSSNVQDGDDDPYESISVTVPGASIVIVKYSGADRYLHLSGGRSPLAYSTSGATRGHNASGASNAFCVAATWVRSPSVPFSGGTANPVETFSSDGPRRMFYQSDGTPITPGNFSATGGVSLQKPDITAADGVATSVPGFESFFGTSASAPHAAAIAALLLSYNPAMTPAEVRLAMESTALDIEALGVDRDSGAGIVMALAALQAPAIPVPRLVFESSTLHGGNENGTIDLNECGELFVVLRNLIFPLGETATGVLAELRTTTPGVVVDPSSRAFPDVPAAGTAVNPIPFRISTGPGYSCSTPAAFSLRVTTDNAGEFNLNFQIVSSAPLAGIAQTYLSTNAPLTIPDLGTVESTLAVTNLSQELEKIRVALHLTHSFDSDLTVSLIGPDGTSVELTANNGGSGANYGTSCNDRTIFDDNAALRIADGLAPFSGPFRPEQTLAAFSGKPPTNANGVWTLRIRDLAAEDSGVLQCWSLETTPIRCLDGGGACLVAPTIVTHPLDIITTNSGAAQFFVQAKGTEPLLYQWYFNGTNLLQGATNASLILDSSTPDQAGSYSAIVTNPYGSATSTPALLTVVSLPQITRQPLDILTTNGMTAQLSVAATGTAPLSYQWFFNATNRLSGATNSTLSLSLVSPATAGQYSVVVANPFGSAVSIEATVTVGVPPVILQQPLSLTSIEGSTARFTVTAGGSEPLSYYWYFNETNLLSTINDSTFELENVTPEVAGGYSVIVSNAFGSLSSIEAELIVFDFNASPLVAITEPTNGSVLALDSGPILLGASASDADGTISSVEFLANGAVIGLSLVAPYRFEWADAPAGTSIISAIATDNQGARTTSAVATITVELASGFSRLVAAGSVWRYFDQGSDLGTLWHAPDFDDFAWASGPAELGYGDNDEATVISFGPSDTEKHITTYFRRAFVLTDSSSITNLVLRLLRDDGAIVYLNGVEIARDNLPEGEITFNTLALNTISGTNEQLFSTNSVNPGLLVDGTNIITAEIHQSGPTSSDLSFNLELLGQRFFGPLILTQPESQTVSEGSSAIFTANVTGAKPLSHQWTFNLTNAIPNATNLTLVLAVANPENSGVYTLISSNAFGVVASSNSQLTVLEFNNPPAVTLHNPINGTVFQPNGNPIVLSASAADTDGSIERVEFYSSGAFLGEISAEPYAFEWLDAPLGSREITAVAFDSQGSATTSAVAQITVRFAANAAHLISTGAVWKYFDAGLDQGTAWRTLSFDDSAWLSGPAQLGYGDGDEATVTSFGLSASDKFPTTYFRREFILTSPGSFASLQLGLLRDDGAVVYLNGVEVFRSNLPEGEISFASLALTSIGGTNESQLLTGPVDPALLRSGTNLIAVEIHQNNATSSDISFDLALEGQRVFQPVFVSIPTDITALPGSSVFFTAQAEGTPPLDYQWFFNGEPVSGQTNATFQVNSVTPASEGRYRLTASNAFGATSTPDTFLTINPSNNLPNVAITSPTNGSIFSLNAAPILIEASASDLEGPIASVSFYANGILLGISPAPPFRIEWLDAPLGAHAIKTIATDMQGGSTTSQVVAVTVDFSAAVARLIPTGATWRYLDTGVDQGTNWINLEFNDSAWATGFAELGYGDAVDGRPETTVVGFGPNANNKYPTTYFRKPFLITDAGAFTNLAVRLLRDDGAVVYLNGSEVFRSNMPTGRISFSTLASGTIANADETNYFTSNFPLTALRNGTNVIAVEVHQANATSSDLSFDLELFAERGTAPFIVAPPSNITVSNGGTATFGIVANGTAPIAFQWYLNQTNLLFGATNSTLTIHPATVAQTGIYSVELSNSLGTVRSPGAFLTIDGGGNIPPAISLLSPTNEARFEFDTPISLTALASDPDGSFVSVSFHVDGVILAESLSSPHEFLWTNAPLGPHAIRVVATDQEGAATSSGIANISVNSRPVGTITLVSTGAVWRYLDDGTDPGISWRGSAFDDSSWASGLAELGYGDESQSRPEATVIHFGDDPQLKHVTYYFRHSFLASTNLPIEQLRVDLLRDDGAIVYLNGVEVFRSNLPEGEVTYLTTAASSVSQADETRYFSTNVDSALLQEGTNVLAVEVHQVNRSSSDISFDLALVSVTSAPPLITVHPQSLSVTNGLSATFSVAATGLHPLRYQWILNATNQLIGETNATLTLAHVSPAEAGIYVVEVANRAGKTYSDPARLAVLNSLPNIPPTVTLINPESGSSFPEQSAIPLSSSAEDTDGFITRIEYYADGVSLGEATNPPYAFDWIGAPLGAHLLQAVAFDNLGATNASASVTITVLNREPDPTLFTLISTGAVWKFLDTGSAPGNDWTRPEFNDSEWPAGLAELGYGDDAEGRPEATVLSYGPNANQKFPSYYFRHSFTTTNAAAITALQLKVLRDDGVIVYLNGTEVFRDNLPAGSITFTNLALKSIVGDAEHEFHDATVPVGLLVEGINLIAVEIHQVNASSSDISFDFELVASRPDAPAIIDQPADQTLAIGQTAQFKVSASGTAPLTYQWYRNSLTAIPNATNATLTITNVQLADEGSYSVTVANVAGVSRSVRAILRVLNAPIIETAPQGITVLAGNSATFSAVVSGAEPLTYRWFYNTNTELQGFNTPTLTLVGVALTNAGTYSVTVSNLAGSASSTPAVLRVLAQSQIVQISQSNGVTAIYFNTVPSLRYTVDFKNTLNTSAWNPLPGAVKLNGTGSEIMVQDSGPVLQSRFYRIRIE